MLSAYRFAPYVFLLATAAYAAPITYSGPLSPLTEVPPITTSTASGFATVTFDPVTELLNVSFNYTGLASAVTGAHIHCCVTPGGNAMVATSVPAFIGFTVPGPTSGSFSATFDMSLAVNYNPAFITANGGTVALAEPAFAAGYAQGLTYLNLHDAVFPGGEIRLLLAAPEPGTSLLVTLAMGALCLIRRKRSV
jgi:hypothetical protein